MESDQEIPDDNEMHFKWAIAYVMNIKKAKVFMSYSVLRNLQEFYSFLSAIPSEFNISSNYAENIRVTAEKVNLGTNLFTRN